MKTRFGVPVMMLFGLLDLSFTNEEAPAQPAQVWCLLELKALPVDTTSVAVEFRYGMKKAKTFTPLMKAIAANSKITHLKLTVPNSSHATNEALEVLCAFKHLESLELDDARDFGGEEIFKQTMVMPKLKKVRFGFR